jgi:hypothetical protein
MPSGKLRALTLGVSATRAAHSIEAGQMSGEQRKVCAQCGATFN